MSAESLAEVAADYRSHAEHARKLSDLAAGGESLPALDVRSWEFDAELMAAARATLQQASRLDLIGVTA